MVMKTRTALEQLYEADETAWLDYMAELVADRRFSALDLKNLEEYLTSMAKRDRRELVSRLVVLLTHLLKWQYQPKKRTGSWLGSILSQQEELKEDVAGGVLRRHALDQLTRVYSRARAQAIAETGLRPERFPEECPWTLDEAVNLELSGTDSK